MREHGRQDDKIEARVGKRKPKGLRAGSALGVIGTVVDIGVYELELGSGDVGIAPGNVGLVNVQAAILNIVGHEGESVSAAAAANFQNGLPVELREPLYVAHVVHAHGVKIATSYGPQARRWKAALPAVRNAVKHVEHGATSVTHGFQVVPRTQAKPYRY